jgi:hypothetical protein
MGTGLNTNNNNVIIPLSKRKLVLLLLISIAFVIGGIEFIINAPAFARPYPFHLPASVVIVIGYVSVGFFGFCTGFITFKFFDARPGLIINSEGIIDNSSAIAVGFIDWADVEKVDVKGVFSQKFIRVFVKNPDKYIDAQSSTVKRKSLTANYKLYDTPINITSNALNYKFDNLYALLTARLNEYKIDAGNS